MTKRIVFIPEPFPKEACAVIEDIAEVRLGVAERAYTEEELAEQVKDVHALIITSRDRITSRVIDSAPVLRVITKSGARPVNVDIEAARRRGISVTWTPGANAVSVAEHTIALMLALAKRLFFVAERLKQGGWRDLSILGNELTGKIIGIVGLGSVGSQVARKLASFEVSILGYDPFIPGGVILKRGATPTELEALLQQADFLSINCELTDATRHMISEPQLRLMKKSAFIINTARGAVVDEKALYKALREGWIAGAGLDVFEIEPPTSSNPLFSLENVVATPHSAAFTKESILRETTWAVEDVKAILTGESPIHWRPSE